MKKNKSFQDRFKRLINILLNYNKIMKVGKPERVQTPLYPSMVFENYSQDL